MFKEFRKNRMKKELRENNLKDYTYSFRIADVSSHNSMDDVFEEENIFLVFVCVYSIIYSYKDKLYVLKNDAALAVNLHYFNSIFEAEEFVSEMEKYYENDNNIKVLRKKVKVERELNEKLKKLLHKGKMKIFAIN